MTHGIGRQAFAAPGLAILMSISWSPLAPAAAQPGGSRIAVEESVLIVTGPIETASFETQHSLSDDDVQSLRPGSAADVLRRLPSAHVPTNTRGESIMFLRNAAERQVGIFYDGAAINVPWDNRLDVSLFPAPLIGEVRAAAGPVSPQYGVNALGVVNLTPRESDGGARAELALEGGDEGYRAGELFLPFSMSGVDLSFGLSVLESDGDPLSEDATSADAPLQVGDDVRTNTDRQIAAVFARARFDFGRHDVALSLIHVDAEKGVAPEPTSNRFWRYPELNHTVGVLSVHSNVGPQTRLDSALWAQNFEQTIQQFSNIGYSTINARQFDEDLTFGLREVLTHEAGIAKLVGSFSVLDSTHRQRDVAASTLSLEYQQRNWSLGGEVELALSPQLIAEIGAGYDVVQYLETGDKPPREDFEGPTGRAGLIWAVTNEWRLRAAIGYKVRTPTMRELFGEALNRFLLNSELEAERITTAEIAAEWRGDNGAFYLIPFAQDLDGAIDQRTVANPTPPPGALRQRINLRGAEVRGVELGGMYRLSEFWAVQGSATFSDVRRRRSSPSESVHLAEKPGLLTNLIVSYEPSAGFGASFEIEHLGRAYSADASGELLPLEAATQANIEINYTFRHGRDRDSEIYLRADNVADEVVLPQFGLPAPGRLIRAGIRHAW